MIAPLKAINRSSAARRWRARLRCPLSAVLYLLVNGAAAATVLTLFAIIVYILVKGVPYLTPELFAFKYTSENVSMFPAIVSTLMMTLLSLAVSAPLAVCTAIYLVEYTGRGNKLARMIRVTCETLSGIPSIVYGLFGMLFFVTALGWGFSLLAGAFTLAVMVLPLIMRTTEEALRSVPDACREASFALGAGKLRTVCRVVLPAAAPGILAGVVLAVGRAAGETAALIYTAGTVAQIPSGGGFLFQSCRTLAIHMYALSNEGLHTGQAFATAVALLATVLVMNALSAMAAKRLARQNM